MTPGLATATTRDALDLGAWLIRPAQQLLEDVAALRARGITPGGGTTQMLLDRLLEQTIPALEAQAEVLPPILEQVGAPVEIATALAAGRSQLGLVAEQLSRLVDSRRSTGERALRPILTTLAKSLGELAAVQRRAAVALAQSPERSEIVNCLEASEAHARERLLFVGPPAYQPTEAHVLRHNPRPPRVLHLNEVRDPSGKKDAPNRLGAS